MFNVNEKPELARGHALQNRAWEKRLHITRERTLSKSIWEAGFDIYVCDSHILQWGRVDRVVQDIFSGDAWLNNLIRLTWQAKMKRCVPALRPLVHFDMRVESYNLVHGDKLDTRVTSETYTDTTISNTLTRSWCKINLMSEKCETTVFEILNNHSHTDKNRQMLHRNKVWNYNLQPPFLYPFNTI